MLALRTLDAFPVYEADPDPHTGEGQSERVHVIYPARHRGTRWYGGGFRAASLGEREQWTAGAKECRRRPQRLRQTFQEAVGQVWQPIVAAYAFLGG